MNEERIKKLRQQAIDAYLAKGGTEEGIEAFMEKVELSFQAQTEEEKAESHAEVEYIFGGREQFAATIDAMSVTEPHIQAMIAEIAGLDDERTKGWTTESTGFAILLNVALVLRFLKIDQGAFLTMASKAGLALDSFEADMGRVGIDPFNPEKE